MSDLLMRLESTFNEHRYLSRLKIARIFFLSLILLEALLSLPYMHEIYSPAVALFPMQGFSGGSDYFLKILTHPSFSSKYEYFIVAQIFFCLLGIFNIQPRISMFAVWIATVNLYSISYPTLNGGNNIIIILMFFLTFSNTSGTPSVHNIRNKYIAEVSAHMTVVGFILARIQICTVYLTAGALKLSGELWATGEALYYIGYSDFSLPWFSSFSESFPVLMSAGTIATIIFQCSFPYLVWNPNLRAPVLFAGVFFHIGIILSMGLFTFGLAMCITYVFFFKEAWVESLQACKKLFVRYCSAFIYRVSSPTSPFRFTERQ